MGAAVRGRWPLMLRTGWVVVRRITWVSPSVGRHPAESGPGTRPRSRLSWAFLFLTNALLAFPELTGPGTLRLSGPLYRKEVPLGPGRAIGSGGRGKARRGTPWRGVAGGVRLGMARASYPETHQDQPGKHLDSSRGADHRTSKQEESAVTI